MRSKALRLLLAALSLSLFGLAAFVPTAPSPSQGKPAKRVYIAMDDHTDYMWTANEETYRKAFLEMIDFYLDQADATAKLPAHQQSRFNCDGSFWMWVYEKNKPAKDFERFIERVRSGHMSVPLTGLISCYGGMPTEAILRSMYYAGTIERRHKVRFPLALAMENQTMPYGLGALFAGSGAKYCWHGICDCATPLKGHFSDREHPLYWWTGPDGSRILMKWYPMLDRKIAVGRYMEARFLTKALSLVESKPFTDQYPYEMVGLFGVGGDDLKTLSKEFPKAAKELSNDQRQVIVSNQVDFFQDVEKTYGNKLPTQGVSFGNDWDTHSATLAEDSARVRRAVEKLRSAEALATLVSLQDPNFLKGRSEARALAWMNLGLYYEHNWVANNKAVKPEERIAWQRRLADEIEAYVNRLHTDAAAALGKLIRREGKQPRFYVFNALGWTRSDIADLPGKWDQPVHVIDLSTGAETPSQVMTLDGRRFLRILAADVPPVGYKVFEVRAGKGKEFPPAAAAKGDILENDVYRVTVAKRGAIISLVDKKRGNREFVKAIDGRAVNDLGAADGALEVENAGPVSVTLRADSAGPLEHTSRITLFRASRRIDLRNDITQNFNDPHTWDFALKIDAPEVWHEEVGAVIRAKLLKDGGHYAMRNARYDWLTLNHYADVSGGGVGVTLSNADCAFMRLGNSTLKQLDTAVPKLSVLAGGNVSGVKLHMTNQGSTKHFLQRFALQTHDAQGPVDAMRFALEHQNPLLAARLVPKLEFGNERKTYPEKSYSLLKVSRPEMFVWSVKPAEEGIAQGVIVRLWNMAHQPVKGMLESTPRLARAKQTTHVETDLAEVPLAEGKLPVALTAQQIKTFRLMVPGGE